MIVERLTSPMLDANCYVVAPGRGRDALVIDPGVLTAGDVSDALARFDLQVGAVLLTHGHFDHVWDAARVAGDAPVYVPAPDLYRLDDPADVMGPAFAGLVEALPYGWTRPKHVEAVPAAASSAAVSLVEDVPVRMLPAPGHSEGSSLFFTSGPVEAGNQSGPGAGPLLCFDGDVVFAGSVGRSDLPGSDPRQMLHTLRTILNVVDPATVFFPGHGAPTTMEREARTNAYLNQARHQG